MTRRSTSLFLVATWAALLTGAGCDRPDDLATPTVPGPEGETPLHDVTVHQPAPLRGIHTGLTDHRGRPVTTPCMTCHDLRDEHDVPATDSVEGLENVHADLQYRHGALACRACHDPERADRLRLADGSTWEMAEAQRLCAQCHGPQFRDWEAGSHGGLRGYWDRRRGPATKNHCVDCHDPHDPRFPQYIPAPPPQDRFVRDQGRSRQGGHDD